MSKCDLHRKKFPHTLSKSTIVENNGGGVTDH